MKFNITKGKQKTAIRLVAYGAEGIGKSTLASQFPDPLFIDTEGGTAHLDVRRLQKPASCYFRLYRPDQQPVPFHPDKEISRLSG